MSPEETGKVLKHVHHRCTVLQDEKELARLSRQLALEDKEEKLQAQAKAKAKAEAERTRLEQAAKEPAAPAANTSPGKVLPVAPILEHGFCIGGDRRGSREAGERIAFAIATTGTCRAPDDSSCRPRRAPRRAGP